MDNNRIIKDISKAAISTNEDRNQTSQTISDAANATALLALMEKTGFSMMQENGQRKFGPPPGWTGPPPSRGCEVFIGKIPRDCFEDELVPVFQKIGCIYEFRLMMDFSGYNRGFAFVMYTDKSNARTAIKELNNFQIRKGRFLGVCASVDNCRLFVGGIPKMKQKEEILNEMRKITDGVADVIVYPSVHEKSKNRGFAFVEYESHRAAAMARRKLIPGRIQLWGQNIAVDWAEPEQDVDDEIMATVSFRLFGKVGIYMSWVEFNYSFLKKVIIAISLIISFYFIYICVSFLFLTHEHIHNLSLYIYICLCECLCVCTCLSRYGCICKT